jgi:putative endonuclease
MYYVYILKNKRTNRLYIGYTEDLKRRLSEHKKIDDSIELVYYEAYIYESQARIRERKLKLYGSAWRGLKKRLGL